MLRGQPSARLLALDISQQLIEPPWNHAALEQSRLVLMSVTIAMRLLATLLSMKASPRAITAAGKYADSTTNSCNPCEPSTFSVGGKDSCDTCASNTFSDTTGATVCAWTLARSLALTRSPA